VWLAERVAGAAAAAATALAGERRAARLAARAAARGLARCRVPRCVAAGLPPALRAPPGAAPPLALALPPLPPAPSGGLRSFLLADLGGDAGAPPCLALAVCAATPHGVPTALLAAVEAPAEAGGGASARPASARGKRKRPSGEGGSAAEIDFDRLLEWCATAAEEHRRCA
jgi:hypothetical protein